MLRLCVLLVTLAHDLVPATVRRDRVTEHTAVLHDLADKGRAAMLGHTAAAVLDGIRTTLTRPSPAPRSARERIGRGEVKWVLAMFPVLVLFVTGGVALIWTGNDGIPLAMLSLAFFAVVIPAAIRLDNWAEDLRELERAACDHTALLCAECGGTAPADA